MYFSVKGEIMIKQNAMFDQFFAYTDITKHDFSYDDIKEEKVILFGMGNTALREFAALRANDILQLQTYTFVYR